MERWRSGLRKSDRMARGKGGRGGRRRKRGKEEQSWEWGKIRGRAGLDRCLPCSDLVRADFFVIAVSASFDALKTVLNPFGEAESSRNALLENIQRRPENTLVDGDARGIALHETLVAVPFIRQVFRLDHIHAFKMERPGTSVAADDVAGVSACRA